MNQSWNQFPKTESKINEIDNKGSCNCVVLFLFRQMFCKLLPFTRASLYCFLIFFLQRVLHHHFSIFNNKSEKFGWDLDIHVWQTCHLHLIRLNLFLSLSLSSNRINNLVAILPPNQHCGTCKWNNLQSKDENKYWS